MTLKIIWHQNVNKPFPKFILIINFNLLLYVMFQMIDDQKMLILNNSKYFHCKYYRFIELVLINLFLFNRSTKYSLILVLKKIISKFLSQMLISRKNEMRRYRTSNKQLSVDLFKSLKLFTFYFLNNLKIRLNLLQLKI